VKVIPAVNGLAFPAPFRALVPIEADAVAQAVRQVLAPEAEPAGFDHSGTARAAERQRFGSGRE
jgi:hypothetical protein